MMRKGLHDDRALGEFGIGIKPLDFREVERRILGIPAVQFEFAAFEDLFGGEILDRNTAGAESRALHIAARSQRQSQEPRPDHSSCVSARCHARHLR
jgi:hypothetical protein